MYHKIILGEIYLNIKHKPIVKKFDFRKKQYVILIPPCKTNIRHNFFILRIGRIYSDLPYEIKQIFLPTKFRNKINKFNLDKYLSLNKRNI